MSRMTFTLFLQICHPEACDTVTTKGSHASDLFFFALVYDLTYFHYTLKERQGV